MREQALRFGIHDAAGYQAATWKLWTTGGGKSEVYLTCRELLGTIKTSFHESGQWHTAYPQNVFEKLVEGAIPTFKDRYFEKWSRLFNIAPGITLAFRIVTPWSAVNTPVKEDKSESITWLPNAPESKATEIDILITKPTTPLTEWPGRQLIGTSFIGALLLANGEITWAVYRIVDMPDFSNLGTGTGHFFKGKNEKDLKGKDLRSFAFGTQPDGSRIIFDCAVRSDAPIE